MAEKEDSSDIEDEIAEKIGDIIYEKAKEDIKSKIRASINNVKQKVRSFFGLKESKRQKIEQISTEIKEKQATVIEDNILGIMELYTVHFVLTMVYFLGVSTSDTPKKEPKQENKNEN